MWFILYADLGIPLLVAYYNSFWHCTIGIYISELNASMYHNIANSLHANVVGVACRFKGF